MKKITVYLSIALIIVSVACSEDVWFDDNKRVTGQGEVKRTELDLPGFESVDLEGVANVYISTGLDQRVSIEAYENILPYLGLSVIGDELIIRFKENISVNSDEEIRVDISVPVMKKVTLSGVGNFYLDGPPQETLYLGIDGVGSIESYDLPVYHGIAEINGNGNIEIRAKETLEVDIDGLGNVYYRDFPDISVDISGLGEVVNDN
ncbi:MAG: DUF2807 domain-containing protein [Bacteroidales bacterium]